MQRINFQDEQTCLVCIIHIVTEQLREASVCRAFFQDDACTEIVLLSCTFSPYPDSPFQAVADSGVV